MQFNTPRGNKLTSSTVSTLEGVASAFDDVGAESCIAPPEDDAGEEGEPGEPVDSDVLNADGDADKSSDCAGWQENEAGDRGHVDGVAGVAAAVLGVGAPLDKKAWLESIDVAEALLVLGVEAVASDGRRLVDGV